MKSLNLQYLDSLTFTTEQASTLKAIGEFRGKQDLYSKQTPDTLETLRQTAIVESSESSNRLEGITAPHNRIEAIVLKSTAPKNRSEQEIAGYRDALALIHESQEYMNFTVNVILQIHSIIYRYIPNNSGRWKMADNEIVERNPDGSLRRVRFKPVSAFETPQAMADLVKEYKEAIDLHNKEPLVVIPLAILDFLCIHPFSDGNGRTGRLLTLLLLYHFDYSVGSYISLERIFEQTKETYYESLEKSSKNWHEGKHDVMPWLTYFWGVLLRAYSEFEERVGSIYTDRGSKTVLIKQAIESTIGPFAISDISAKLPGVSRDMIRLVLRQLRDKGIILPEGKGRGAKWRLGSSG